MEPTNISNKNFYHTEKIQIRFNDIDIAGHVNNAVYQYYYDYGKLRFLDAVFGNLIVWEKYGFVLLNININYVTPIYLHDNIEVQTRIEKIGTKSVLIQQVIREQNTKGEDGIKSIAESVMVAYNFVEKQSMEIPENWKNAAYDFEKMKK